MRIGFDAKWYFDGPVSGRVAVRNILDALAKDAGGHEVVVITDKRFDDRPLPRSIQTFERIGMWSGNSLIANAFFLNKAAEQARCDALFLQTFTPAFPKMPTVALIHDILFRDYPQFYTPIERLYFSPVGLLAGRASRICTVSESERDRIVRAGIAEKSRIDIVPMGVSERFIPLAEHETHYMEAILEKFSLPSRFLLYVGRLNARKNINGLLKALPLLADKTIPLVVVGSSEWKSEDPHKIIAEYNLQERVLFLGEVDDHDLPGIYALALAFVFPSWAEGFGIPPLEAMRCGVPCIVSDATSLPEVCGDAAVYFDPSSPISIASAIQRVLDDEKLRSRLADDGRARAAACSWSRTSAAVLYSVEQAIKYVRH